MGGGGEGWQNLALQAVSKAFCRALATQLVDRSLLRLDISWTPGCPLRLQQARRSMDGLRDRRCWRGPSRSDFSSRALIACRRRSRLQEALRTVKPAERAERGVEASVRLLLCRNVAPMHDVIADLVERIARGLSSRTFTSALVSASARRRRTCFTLSSQAIAGPRHNPWRISRMLNQARSRPRARRPPAWVRRPPLPGRGCLQASSAEESACERSFERPTDCRLGCREVGAQRRDPRAPSFPSATSPRHSS
jgi:hypothetical protein